MASRHRGACASSQAEQVRDARTEQIEAQTSVQEKAVDERADARDETIEQGHDAQKERIDQANPPAEGASKTLVNVSEERAKYESEATARLNKLSARINAAQQKLQVLGPRAPTPIKTELDTTATQYDLLKNDVMKLEATPPEQWEQKKQEIDNRTSQLDERVSELSDKIDDV